MHFTRSKLWLALFVAVALVGCPGNPPPTDTPQPPVTPPSPPPVSAGVAAIDTSSRAAVAAAYNSVYLGAQNNPVLSGTDWTGDLGTCKPGATSSAFKNATLRRVNFYRALAGLPNVAWVASGAAADNAQAAALLMAANGSLSHSPPITWKCYSDAGKAGAGSSNLAGGNDGPDAIDAYMDDGGGNNEAAGHRRWILFPPRLEMASGDVPGWNALYVFGKSGARPSSPAFVAYPSPGFFPRALAPRSKRWSFALPGADFSKTAVTMSAGGTALALTKLALKNGYGDNTLVWEVNTAALPTTGEVTVEVKLESVIVNGAAQVYAYTVRLFDP